MTFLHFCFSVLIQNLPLVLPPHDGGGGAFSSFETQGLNPVEMKEVYYISTECDLKIDCGSRNDQLFLFIPYVFCFSFC